MFDKREGPDNSEFSKKVRKGKKLEACLLNRRRRKLV
jgi:hypothetical protein